MTQEEIQNLEKGIEIMTADMNEEKDSSSIIYMRLSPTQDGTKLVGVLYGDPSYISMAMHLFRDSKETNPDSKVFIAELLEEIASRQTEERIKKLVDYIGIPEFEEMINRVTREPRVTIFKRIKRWIKRS